MDYAVSFGSLSRSAPASAAAGTKFRLAVLGDLSGRANAGTLETGKALAKRKPIKIDVDNLDQVIERMKLSLSLPVGPQGDVVEIGIADIDAFHPDQLFENVELFEALADLRKRLNNRGSFDRAAKEVLGWGEPDDDEADALDRRPPPKPRGNTIATDRKLEDFARLIGQPTARPDTERAVEDLVRSIVGAHIEPARDAKQDQLVARVDAALSSAMRNVLHHPDFQTMESTWRSIEFLVRRLETGARLEVVLYDVSAEELAADLASTDALEQTGLYGLLVEQPALDAQQGAISAVIGLYGFELAPPHADLLGRLAHIAAAARAPFIVSMAPDGLKTPMHEQHPLVQQAFNALYELPEAAYLGLAAPRFLLRMPYGRKSDPIDAFPFEEFTREAGLSSMLWGNPALLAGFLIALSYQNQGAKLKLGSIATVNDMPYYVYTDTDGDQVALPCTERMYSERQAVAVSAYRVMPLLSLRGRPEVRLGSFNAVSRTPMAGFWAPASLGAAAPPQTATAPVQPVATTTAASPVEAEDAAASDTAEPDLDALLASLSTPDTAAMEAAPDAAPTAPDAAGTDDLDALLASLSADAPPTAEGETEPDLDALLASLK